MARLAPPLCSVAAALDRPRREVVAARRPRARLRRAPLRLDRAEHRRAARHPHEPAPAPRGRGGGREAAVPGAPVRFEYHLTAAGTRAAAGAAEPRAVGRALGGRGADGALRAHLRRDARARPHLQGVRRRGHRARPEGRSSSRRTGLGGLSVPGLALHLGPVLAPVAQWIEQRFPKPRALVRFRSGASAARPFGKRFATPRMLPTRARLAGQRRDHGSLAPPRPRGHGGGGLARALLHVHVGARREIQRCFAARRRGVQARSGSRTTTGWRRTSPRTAWCSTRRARRRCSARTRRDGLSYTATLIAETTPAQTTLLAETVSFRPPKATST